MRSADGNACHVCNGSGIVLDRNKRRVICITCSGDGTIGNPKKMAKQDSTGPESNRLGMRVSGRRYRKPEDTESIGVRLPRSDLRDIDLIVAQSGGKYSVRSDFIRKAVRAALFRHREDTHGPLR